MLDQILERLTSGHYQASLVEEPQVQVTMIGLPLELLRLPELLVSRDPFGLAASSSYGHPKMLALPRQVVQG